MKTAGIITFHCADNFGAVLQAYALMSTIQNMNIHAEFINFTPRELIEPYSIFPNIKNSIQESGNLRTIRKLISGVKNYKSSKYKTINYLKFRRDYLNISAKTFYNPKDLINDPPKYDYYITGSDQVWNPDFFSVIGNSYFLDFVKDGKKISYAASIAKSPEDKWSTFFQVNLDSFDNISVREKSAQIYLEEILSENVSVVIDPTLLLSKDQWNRISTKKFNLDKYVLVYDLIKNPLIVDIANKVAEKYNCKIISYSKQKGYNNWHGSFSNLSPTDFIGLFSNAEFIVTSSFHGTAFAIIFNKPFITIPHPTRGSRMIDLLNDLKLNDRIVNDISELESMDFNINYKETNHILSSLKKISVKYLRNALNLED